MKRSWLIYWAALSLLGLAAIVIPIVYNLGLQLSPAQVEVARQRWTRSGPTDYELLALIRHDEDPNGEELRIKVTGEKVTQVVQNNQPLLYHDAMALVVGGVIEPPVQLDFSSQTVEGLFLQIERQLETDAAANPGVRRNYTTATFDARDGHPIRYVHRVSGTRQRHEWQIKLISQPAR